MAARTSCAAAAAARPWQGYKGRADKACLPHVYLHLAHKEHKLPCHAEGKAALFLCHVLIIHCLVHGKDEHGAGDGVDAEGWLFLARKAGLEKGFGLVGKYDHGGIPMRRRPRAQDAKRPN